VCAVKAPGFRDRRHETCQDLAVLTGGRAITLELGFRLENLTLADLGQVRSVIVTRSTTTLIGGAGQKEDIDLRAKQIRSQIDAATSDYEREKLQSRLAKLLGGVAVVEVGGATESEMMERKARVEDALHATRAAVEEGVVPGGGVALLRCLPALVRLKLDGEQQFGVNIVRRALEEPLRQIAANGGFEGAVVVATVLGGTDAFGYNAASNTFEDLVLAGVIDPTKVVRVALENAASVASMMLTTEALIATQLGQAHSVRLG
jgi:chaperonin GroEL